MTGVTRGCTLKSSQGQKLYNTKEGGGRGEGVRERRRVERGRKRGEKGGGGLRGRGDDTNTYSRRCRTEIPLGADDPKCPSAQGIHASGTY